MKTKRNLAIVAILGLMVSCAPMSPYETVDSSVLRKVAQNARTRSQHEALTKYFENLAREMRVKAEEQKALLEHYQEKGYLYGRQAQDHQSHTWALMNRYELAIEKSRTKAAFHRQTAAGLARDDDAITVRQTNATTNANSRQN